jgi:3-hydroxymyristoyl/3-hydroxydecanoyl-(acyl carrier protein) dehydratase
MVKSESLDIPADHPSFAGHFPGAPILPGVILLDRVLCAIAVSAELDLLQSQLASVKFLGVVRPGEDLRLEHETLANGSISFSVHSAERLIASGRLSAPQTAHAN